MGGDDRRIRAFLDRWPAGHDHRNRNGRMFLAELCGVLGIEPPDGGVPTPDGVALFQPGRFVLEARWGALGPALTQARHRVAGLPEGSGIPPFLILIDIGRSFALFADFTGSGRHYSHFPDTQSFRFRFDALTDADLRADLRTIWDNPQALDPGRRAATATRTTAGILARLAASLEREQAPERVAGFLMACLTSRFAEELGLLPEGAFTGLLRRHRTCPLGLCRGLRTLWQSGRPGGLDRDSHPLLLTPEQIALLIQAAEGDWRAVEPAIFGTLLERALETGARHRSGTHYTPRAYIERLVLPTILEPLRAEWEAVTAAGPTAAAVRAFHHRLCTLAILDPACGSGNFLYVTLEHLKRLEGEVLEVLATDLGQPPDGFAPPDETVGPRQFHGIETNERAAAVAEQVLWLGHWRWHARSRPVAGVWPAPAWQPLGTIRTIDALLTWERGQPTATAAVWPPADFIIGNPPFIGGKDLRRVLGADYTRALWTAYRREVPKAADLVMYWWHLAALRVRSGQCRGFGLITTNSLPQTFNRRVVERHLGAAEPLGLDFAIPDHPWIAALGPAALDRSEGEAEAAVAAEAARDTAQVRIAMTVGVRGPTVGRLLTVGAERPGRNDAPDIPDIDLHERRGTINPDLTIGADLTTAHGLKANQGLASPGVKLHGAGFIVTAEQATALGLGRVAGLEQHILPYRNGRDLAGRPRGVMVIDLFGLSEPEVRQRFPEVHQWLLARVRPDRAAQAGTTADADHYAQAWWLFGKTRPVIRHALSRLSRYIATGETARHRVFQFLDRSIRPDNMLVCVASDDPYHLGLLSSRFHEVWALAAGGRLGVGNDPRYTKSRCFDTFPFPEATPDQRRAIGALAEELDALRKDRQASHPELTLTGLYATRARLRSGAPLTAGDRTIAEIGRLDTLSRLHDRIDATVAAAYGWPDDLPDDAILTRVLAQNLERHREETVLNRVRWLRPDLQAGVSGPMMTDRSNA